MKVLLQMRSLFSTKENEAPGVKPYARLSAVIFDISTLRKAKATTYQIGYIVNDFTVEEHNDVNENIAYIKIFNDQINKLDPLKKKMSALRGYTSLKRWYNELYRRICEVEKRAVELNADGYTTSKIQYPNPLKKNQQETVDTKVEKKVKGDKKKKVKTEHLTPCEGCGQQNMTYDKPPVPHTFENCYLRGHPNRNKNKAIAWDKSEFGLKFKAQPIKDYSRLQGVRAWKNI